MEVSRCDYQNVFASQTGILRTLMSKYDLYPHGLFSWVWKCQSNTKRCFVTKRIIGWTENDGSRTKLMKQFKRCSPSSLNFWDEIHLNITDRCKNTTYIVMWGTLKSPLICRMPEAKFWELRRKQTPGEYFLHSFKRVPRVIDINTFSAKHFEVKLLLYGKHCNCEKSTTQNYLATRKKWTPMLRSFGRRVSTFNVKCWEISSVLQTAKIYGSENLFRPHL